MVDVLIESTRDFEKDLLRLGKDDREAVIKHINNCASLFPNQKTSVYRKLRRLPLPSPVNGYQSSVYTLKTSQKLRVILAVDEDPIFEQVIFTLFRVVERSDMNQAYKSIAESLYQELLHKDREAAQVS